MAKLESSLKNMILSLTSICLVAAGLLAGVYMLTADPIEKAAQAKEDAAKAAVLAGQEGTSIVAEAGGFGGPIKVMVGFAADGTILGYEVLDCGQETPGLGSKCVDWFKDSTKPGQCIVGRKATGNFTVSKDGGDVDAITAATISSRAFLSAINSAYAEFAGAADCCSGATQKAEPACEHHCAGEGECMGDGSCGKCQGACGHHHEGACGHHEEGACEHMCNHNHMED